MKLEGALVEFIFSLIFSSLDTYGKLLILSTGVGAPFGMESSYTSHISSQYSLMVRSLENLPQFATDAIDLDVQSSSTL